MELRPLNRLYPCNTASELISNVSIIALSGMPGYRKTNTGHICVDGMWNVLPGAVDLVLCGKCKSDLFQCGL